MPRVRPRPKPPPLPPTPKRFFAFASSPPQFRPQSKPLTPNSQSFVAYPDSHTAAIGGLHSQIREVLTRRTERVRSSEGRSTVEGRRWKLWTSESMLHNGRFAGRGKMLYCSATSHKRPDGS